MPSDDELTRALARAFPDTPDDFDRLRDRLVVAADGDGVLDVAYRTVDSPFGRLLVATTDVGLVRLAFAREDHDLVLSELARRVSPRVLHAPARLDDVAAALDEYFLKRRRSFDLPLDWQLTGGFRSTVLHLLPEIAYGRTATYAAIAELAHNPRVVRAVGSACATNPLPIVIPCHRVVRTDGTIGAYLGGTATKRALLELESQDGSPAF